MTAPVFSMFAPVQGQTPQGAAAPGGMPNGALGVFDALLAAIAGETPDGQAVPAEPEKTDPATLDPAAQPQVVASLFTPPAPMAPTPETKVEGEAAPQTAAHVQTFAVPAPPPEAAPATEAALPEAVATAAPETAAAPIETAQVAKPDAALKSQPETTQAPAPKAEATPQLQTQPQEPVQAQARVEPAPPSAPPPTVQAALSPALQAQAAPPAVTPAPAAPAKAEAKPAKGEEKATAPSTASRATAPTPNTDAPPTPVDNDDGPVDFADAAPGPELAADMPDALEAKPPAPAANAAPPSNAAQALVEHAPAAPVRGSPETVAHLAAQILGKLDARTTRFEIALDPHGMGRVDVSLEIAADGALSARMSFDSPHSAAELRGRSAELRQALEQAGFQLADNALSFDVANQGQREQRGEPERRQHNPNARAFEALMASDDEAALSHSFERRTSGVDVRI